MGSEPEVDYLESNGRALQEQRTWILVTGGAGYIGSHTVLQLLLEGYCVLIIDNLDNSCEKAVNRVRKLAGEFRAKNLEFFKGDLREVEDLQKVFQLHRFEAVIHFAGLKAVGESVAKPLLYYNNKLMSTINLLDVMSKHNCKNFVFSSSATVYCQPASVPCTEDYPLHVRDYIHVMDLASGHTKALEKLFSTPDIGCEIYKLGTGRGTSVLEMVSAFEKASGKKIPLRYAGRPPGDSSEIYAATLKAEKELGWRAKLEYKRCAVINGIGPKRIHMDIKAKSWRFLYRNLQSHKS